MTGKSMANLLNSGVISTINRKPNQNIFKMTAGLILQFGPVKYNRLTSMIFFI